MTTIRFLCGTLLLGLLLPGLAARAEEKKPAHDFKRWEGEIAAMEKQDRAKPPAKGGLLFVGSSTVRLWTSLADDFPDHHVINRGFGGCQIVDCTYYAERIIFPHEPRMVLLRAGGNDIHAGKTPEQVFGEYQEFVKKVQAKLPDAEIAYIALCPSIDRWKEAAANKSLNEKVAAFVRDKPKLKYVETYDMTLDRAGHPRPELFAPDKLHLNAAGYKLLAERVRPQLPKPAAKR